MMLETRQYQTEAISRFYTEVREGRNRVMLCAPTGAGKMVIAVRIIQQLLEHGKRVNFIVDRNVLVNQASQSLHRFGVRHGVVSGNFTARTSRPAMVMSTQSMRSRKISPAAYDLNIIDEAHITHKYIADRMDRGKWLGLSASPFKKGLADLFDSVLNVATTMGLQESGYLAPLRVFSGVPMDVTKTRRTNAGEYQAEDLSAETLRVVGDIYREWETKTQETFGRPVKTIVFGNTVADCRAIAAEFQAAGHNFHAVSYLDDQHMKDRLIKDLRDGNIMGLVSCEMLQRGFDVPDILCGIDAHPWRKSLSSVVQQCGRAMRIHEGKEYALWLDPAQNCIRHRDRLAAFWRDGINKLVPMDNKAGKDEPDRKDTMCPSCQAVMMGGRCNVCGWERPKRTPSPGEPGSLCVDGKLVALEIGDPRKHVAKVGRSEYELPPPAAGWSGLCAIAQAKYADRERAQKWCQANYRKLYGGWRMARFDPEKVYDAPTPALSAAVDHSNELYVAGIKRRYKTNAA